MSSSYHTRSRESWRQHSICKTGSISWQERLADLLTHRLIFTDKLTRAQTQKHTNKTNLIHHYNGVTPFFDHRGCTHHIYYLWFFFLWKPNPSSHRLWIFHIYGVEFAANASLWFIAALFCLSFVCPISSWIPSSGFVLPDTLISLVFSSWIIHNVSFSPPTFPVCLWGDHQ